MVRFHADQVFQNFNRRRLPFMITLTPVGEITPEDLETYAQDVIDAMQTEFILMMEEARIDIGEVAPRVIMEVLANSLIGDGTTYPMHSAWPPFELDAAALEAWINSVQTSNRSNLMTFSWTFVFTPPSFFHGGARAVRMPKDLEAKVKKGSMDRKSWESHTYYPPRGGLLVSHMYPDAIGHPITCAAFAIIWTQTTGRQREKCRFRIKVLKEAYELQTRMGWGETVTLNQLTAYTQLYRQTRIICFVKGCKRYNDQFKYQHADWDSENGKTIYIYWDDGIVFLP
jgi:hypothetical protein